MGLFGLALSMGIETCNLTWRCRIILTQSEWVRGLCYFWCETTSFVATGLHIDQHTTIWFSSFVIPCYTLVPLMQTAGLSPVPRRSVPDTYNESGTSPCHHDTLTAAPLYYHQSVSPKRDSLPSIVAAVISRSSSKDSYFSEGSKMDSLHQVRPET